MKNIRNVAIIAHVDHGKTTLVDKLLQKSGTFRENEQVETRVMDSNDLEKERGITIFSKQAVFNVGEKEVMLLDTPGHIDFSAEMERTLSVLDYAVLVIDGISSVQSHTETIWQLLGEYNIPVFGINLGHLGFMSAVEKNGIDRISEFCNWSKII